MGLFDKFGKAVGVSKKPESEMVDPKVKRQNDSILLGWNYVRRMILHGARDFQENGERTRIDRVCEKGVADMICHKLAALNKRGLKWDEPDDFNGNAEVVEVSSKGKKTYCILREEFVDESFLTFVDDSSPRHSKKNRIQEVTLELKGPADYRLISANPISDQASMIDTNSGS